MKHPFTIEVADNQPMKAFDLLLSVGNFKTREDAEAYAKLLADFVAGNDGSFERVQ